MMPHLTPRQFARIATASLVVLIVALTIVRSRHGEQAVVLAPLEHRDAETLVEELARCRTITSDETANPALKAPAAPVKNQDRVVPREAGPQQGEAH
jgi:conjugative transfer region protein TrbK